MNNFYYRERLRKGKPNNPEDILKAFESHPSVEKIK